MERILQCDEDVERGLSVGEHVGWIEEVGEGGGLVGDGLLEEVVRHLLLYGGLEVTLVVVGKLLEEGRAADDVGVGGDGERFGNFGSDENVITVGLPQP